MSSKQVEIIHNIPLADGETIKQKNMRLNHTISIGTLVETKSEYNYGWEGMRLFVVFHSRDCDGTPLYGLGDESGNAFMRGLSRDNLIVIKQTQGPRARQ